jgi:TM2 domain-containing membrane protein YozV
MCAVKEGCFMKKRKGTAGAAPDKDKITEKGSYFKVAHKWVTLDWSGAKENWKVVYYNSQQPVLSSTGTFSPGSGSPGTKLTKRKSIMQLAGVASSAALDASNQEPGKCIMLSNIDDLYLDPPPAASFRIYTDSNTVVLQFVLQQPSAELSALWMEALYSAVQLQQSCSQEEIDALRAELYDAAEPLTSPSALVQGNSSVNGGSSHGRPRSFSQESSASAARYTNVEADGERLRLEVNVANADESTPHSIERNEGVNPTSADIIISSESTSPVKTLPRRRSLFSMTTNSISAMFTARSKDSGRATSVDDLEVQQSKPFASSFVRSVKQADKDSVDATIVGSVHSEVGRITDERQVESVEADDTKSVSALLATGVISSEQPLPQITERAGSPGTTSFVVAEGIADVAAQDNSDSPNKTVLFGKKTVLDTILSQPILPKVPVVTAAEAFQANIEKAKLQAQLNQLEGDLGSSPQSATRSQFHSITDGTSTGTSPIQSSPLLRASSARGQSSTLNSNGSPTSRIRVDIHSAKERMAQSAKNLKSQLRESQQQTHAEEQHSPVTKAIQNLENKHSPSSNKRSGQDQNRSPTQGQRQSPNKLVGIGDAKVVNSIHPEGKPAIPIIERSSKERSGVEASRSILTNDSERGRDRDADFEGSVDSDNMYQENVNIRTVPHHHYPGPSGVSSHAMTGSITGIGSPNVTGKKIVPRRRASLMDYFGVSTSNGNSSSPPKSFPSTSSAVSQSESPATNGTAKPAIQRRKSFATMASTSLSSSFRGLTSKDKVDKAETTCVDIKEKAQSSPERRTSFTPILSSNGQSQPSPSADEFPKVKKLMSSPSFKDRIKSAFATLASNSVDPSETANIKDSEDGCDADVINDGAVTASPSEGVVSSLLSSVGVPAEVKPGVIAASTKSHPVKTATATLSSVFSKVTDGPSGTNTSDVDDPPPPPPPLDLLQDPSEDQKPKISEVNGEQSAMQPLPADAVLLAKTVQNDLTVVLALSNNVTTGLDQLYITQTGGGIITAVNLAGVYLYLFSVLGAMKCNTLDCIAGEISEGSIGSFRLLLRMPTTPATAATIPPKRHPPPEGINKNNKLGWLEFCALHPSDPKGWLEMLRLQRLTRVKHKYATRSPGNSSDQVLLGSSSPTHRSRRAEESATLSSGTANLFTHRVRYSNKDDATHNVGDVNFSSANDKPGYFVIGSRRPSPQRNQQSMDDSANLLPSAPSAPSDGRKRTSPGRARLVTVTNDAVPPGGYAFPTDAEMYRGQKKYIPGRTDSIVFV